MSRAPVLKKRAAQLSKSRAFFAERNVLEIDCAALVRHPSIDAHIDCLNVEGSYLHASPECLLKRLLAEGVGDCYFLGHVFRKEELGRLHNPEFTMVEWYRLGYTLDQMIQETAEFLFLFFGQLPIQLLSYDEAFEKYVEEKDFDVRPNWTKQDQIHYLFSHKIEPNLGQNELTVIIDYPPQEAALATLKKKKGRLVAERFEIYYQGVELANGYHELANAEELKERFNSTLFDEKFLAALKNLPDCCGVALGFDRALMLQCKCDSIKQVIPFAWNEL